MRDQGRWIGGDQAFAFANADNKRATLTGDDDPARLVGGNHGDAVGAFDLTEGVDHGLTQVTFVIFADQAGHGLGVGLRRKDMPLGLELRADDPIVLNDAVMDQTDAPAGICMRMGVGLGRRPVRRPTRMGDANGATGLTVFGPFGTDFVGQTGDLAHGTQGQERFALLDGETSGVITSIFQTPQPAKQDRRSGVATDISDDAAHGQARMSLSTMAPGKVDVLGHSLRPG